MTTSFGDGHNSAARGVAAAMGAIGEPHTGAFDLLGHLRPETMRVLGGGYRALITRWPRGWSWLYGAADRLPMGGDTPDPLPALTRGVADYLNRLQPRAIVSTYPLYGHLVERLFGAGPLPFGLVTVVTDSTSVNHSWINAADGHYAVADEASAGYLRDHGVPDGRVHVTGFPVDPAFGRGRPANAEATPPSPFRIVYAPSTKTATVIATLEALRETCKRSPVDVQLTVVLGRHEARLKESVEAHCPPDTNVLGWTDRMPELLRNGHLLIGKAGGATVQESLAAGCPMLVNYVVPGQEEGNAQLLCELGAGAMMPPPDQLAGYLLDLLGGGGWTKFRRIAIARGRAGAAETIARLALDLAP